MSEIIHHPALRDPLQFHRPDYVDEPLYVITPVFNPQRYRARWKHYKNFEKYVLDSGAHLVTIEATFGQREDSIINEVHENHTVIHIRTSQEIWLKENMINIAISRLPPTWKYVAWLDSDITFSRPDWVGETIQQLQHYKLVQMFSEAYDLNYDWETLKQHKGFVWCYKHEQPDAKVPNTLGKVPGKPKDGYVTNIGGLGYWHPGYCWAARREAIESLGGLIDWGILGGGDTFMAYALIGALNQRTMPNSLGASGVKLLQAWQDRAEKYIRRNVGYVKGTLLHHWHGSKKDRAYYDRGTILTNAKFDVGIDLYKDSQGAYQINPENILLRDGAQSYFQQRNEDGIK
jgi:hypothetical protein